MSDLENIPMVSFIKQVNGGPGGQNQEVPVQNTVTPAQHNINPAQPVDPTPLPVPSQEEYQDNLALFDLSDSEDIF